MHYLERISYYAAKLIGYSGQIGTIKSSYLPRAGFVFGSPEFNPSKPYKQPTGQQPPAIWDS